MGRMAGGDSDLDCQVIGKRRRFRPDSSEFETQLTTHGERIENR